MMVDFPAAGGDFLMHYHNDLPLRWSPDDLVAQQSFASQHLESPHWLDWSDESAALQLIQANLLETSLGAAGEYPAVLVAGPVTELISPAVIFASAVRHLRTHGRLIAIIPCLRDNSPESKLFAEKTAKEFWPYYTSEEVLEMAREAGLEPDAGASQFVPIPRFTEVVLKDQLGFKGFRHVFTQLEKEGYDPVEIGWGELRLVAAPRKEPSEHL